MSRATGACNACAPPSSHLLLLVLPGKSGFHCATFEKNSWGLGGWQTGLSEGWVRQEQCRGRKREEGGRAGAAGLGTVVPSVGILQVPVCRVLLLILPSLIQVNRTCVHNENKQAGLENIMSQ